MHLGYKTFSYSIQLSMEDDLLKKLKCLNYKDFSCFQTFRLFVMLISVLMPKIDSILIFLSMINFILISVGHEKNCTTSGPVFQAYISESTFEISFCHHGQSTFLQYIVALRRD